MGSNRFWHIVSVVKERLASLSSRAASSEPNKNNIPCGFVNTDSDHFFFSTKFLSPASISIILRRDHSAPRSIIRHRVGARAARAFSGDDR
jgi:hypothetical protein